jgi:hypothetical protein
MTTARDEPLHSNVPAQFDVPAQFGARPRPRAAAALPGLEDSDPLITDRLIIGVRLPTANGVI